MTSRIAALSLLVGLALTGCGSAGDAVDSPGSEATGTPASASTTSVPAADGETVEGDGYSYRIPEGWGEPDEEVAGFDPDTLISQDDVSDGFGDNLNVLKLPAPPDADADAVEEQALQELRAVGATEVEVGERAVIDGAEAAHVSGVMSLGSQKYTIEQYYPVRDDSLYVATFSFSPTVDQAARDDLARSVLASWQWS
ncbi:hypothetical protein FE697_010870 [Mumia zhuanghuii]|uniref:PsbP protein n=2 Tax=Mumia TaxID=1546255 RepID=A0ABW1QHC0_9ACTN|nr:MULTISPECIES: hypothetical protein [Mumia]KAA1422677.1 hypothetical protein FE697_010870 [Mumia zhuanghuii]